MDNHLETTIAITEMEVKDEAWVCEEVQAIMVVVTMAITLVKDERIGTAVITTVEKTVEKTVAMEDVMALMPTDVAVVYAEAVMASTAMVTGVAVG